MALLLLLPRRLRLPFLLRETRQERRGDSSSSGSSSSSSALLRSEQRRRQRRRRPEAGGARPQKSLFEECVFLLLLLFPANAALFLPLFLIWANTVKRRAARRGQSICACRKTMDERERSTRSRSRFFPFFPHFATGYFLSLPSRERFCSRLAPPFSHDGGALLRGHPRPPGRRCPRPGAVAALFRRGARRQTRHPRQRRRHFGDDSKMLPTIPSTKEPTSSLSDDANPACDVCKWAWTNAQQALADPDTQAQVMRFAEETACGMLPSDEAQKCKEMAREYLPNAIAALESFDADEACGAVGFCPQKGGNGGEGEGESEKERETRRIIGEALSRRLPFRRERCRPRPRL